jgi:hypothetical protein
MGGRMKTTLFYGPWQCNQKFMGMCQKECASDSHLLMGCMWLADIKLDWEGHLLVPPLPVKAGSRYPIFHCCCDYRPLAPAEKKPLRDRWESQRESFRNKWSSKFGEWPAEDGVAWPGHHILDLWHGGDPVDPNNIIPVEPSVHIDFGRKYPACYEGKAPWNAAGADLPYTDE